VATGLTRRQHKPWQRILISYSNEKRGVGVHPHKGFETVSVVYQGEFEHRDSSGGGNC
jgi:redox-sensitive bicupin YhaK (pirin superfamily)